MADFLQNSFSQVNPDVSIGRSTFTGNSYDHKTTITEGDLVPVYFSEVLPGDTFSVDTSFLIRMATPIYPVADNCAVDIFYFFVPNRLVWSHWREFCGENTSDPWVQTTEYSVPQLKFFTYSELAEDPSYITSGCTPGSIMNYFGVPCTTFPDQYLDMTVPAASTFPVVFSVSDLPNRAYRLIWNEFFRSEALQYPVAVYTDDSDRYFKDMPGLSPYASSDNYGGRCFKVNRFFDFFSSALPAPQMGNSVDISLLNTTFPVIAQSPGNTVNVLNADALHWAWRNQNGTGDWSTNLGNNFIVHADTQGVTKGSDPGPLSNPIQLTPQNLHAIVDDFSIGSINQLREAFAVQRFLELQARGGTRYREILQTFFNVTSPDSRVQVPEYLGGDRIPINMDQVLQTSSTDAVSPQGNTSGYSLTTSVESSFTKSFVEHGMVIGLACVRVFHTYPQACHPFWFKKRKFDFYWPQFANLGEQPILKRHICPTGFSYVDNQVFGYLPAWNDYRYRFNQATGSFSPYSYVNTSDSKIYQVQPSIAQAWTYSDYYDLQYSLASGQNDLSYIDDVTLSSEWLQEDSVNIAQTLAVQNEPQFIADFHFDVKTTRPMPVTSIPGLIDHH